ncbi:hypothetical protein GBAR_LOCUS20252, partial [Geodia barretti]
QLAHAGSKFSAKKNGRTYSSTTRGSLPLSPLSPRSLSCAELLSWSRRRERRTRHYHRKLRRRISGRLDARILCSVVSGLQTVCQDVGVVCGMGCRREERTACWKSRRHYRKCFEWSVYGDPPAEYFSHSRGGGEGLQQKSNTGGSAVVRGGRRVEEETGVAMVAESHCQTYESIGCDLLDFTERERTSNNVGEGIRATDVHRVRDNRRGNHRCWTTVGRVSYFYFSLPLLPPSFSLQITVCFIEICIRMCSRKEATKKLPRKQEGPKPSPPPEQVGGASESSEQTDEPGEVPVSSKTAAGVVAESPNADKEKKTRKRKRNKVCKESMIV